MTIAAPTLSDLPKQYAPRQAEDRWYKFWEAQGYFHSEPDSSRKPFTIVIPPPNVTGALHLGHALNNTLQDILVRWRRMQGYCTLWVPGTDHAGIATQAVVERRLLAEEKLSRHDLGRAALVDRIWAWKKDYEARILGQLKQMGCSCDWQRTRFTLDGVCARAVRHTFFRMFQEGLIYRGKRLVNWDTFLQTAVSDDEVFHETVAGHFWHFSYPVIDPQPGEPERVTFATTRPETMLGDTAVAIHPDPEAQLDKLIGALQAELSSARGREKAEISQELDRLSARRKELLPALLKLRDMANAGRMVRIPLLDREIPLVADEWAKPEMGSGCVKITPAHDPNDYEVGLRKHLPMINILNPDGTLNENAGKYQGQTIRQARESVVADMEQLGCLEQIEDREIDLAHSDRSKTPIEPYLADQWFVKMDDLAQSAIDAVAEQRVRIHPPRYSKGYIDWLSEKRDWPISRQLWWGHQIPVWYAPAASEDDLKQAFGKRDDVIWTKDAESGQWLICSREEDLHSDAVSGHQLVQEPDVLDTWFSSALWPHSTLGWPEPTPELNYFYPTSTLITSRDIITLWVARMVLSGIFNVGKVPFHEVYIHPKILDGFGEGMSKSKGNGVDPLDVIEKFGADSLRFALAYLTTETQDIRMPVEFECPHCGELIPQTKKNRVQPRIDCKKCGKTFGTQWASKPEEKALPRGAVVSDRFELSRNFCNKLWNASRFVLLNLEGYTPAPLAPDDLAVEDRWILSRLGTVTENVTSALDTYRYADAARLLYSFAWDEFCSFYLETVKHRLQDASRKAVAQRVLAYVLDTLLRLLHPFIPFVTEEVWQLLGEYCPERGFDRVQPSADSVMIAEWPKLDAQWIDESIEAQFALFQRVLRGVRDIRHQQNIAPKTEIAFSVRADESSIELLKPMRPYFFSMAGARPMKWGPDVEPPPLAAKIVEAGIEVYVDLADLIDVEAEIARNQKELDKLQGLIAGKEKKLANESFISRAPAEVVQQERDNLQGLLEKKVSIQATLAELQAKAK